MLLDLTIKDRYPVAGGEDFGAGAYEAITGEVTFGIDPQLPLNAPICDLDLAPADAAGLVCATADFHLLCPTDPRRASGTLLFNVVNRGNFNALAFNRAAAGNGPRDRAQFGDGLLQQYGMIIAACGWQADLAPGNNRLQLRPPAARVSGVICVELKDVRAGECMPIAHVDHLPYPPSDPEQPDAVLTVRDAPLEDRSVVPRERWRFVADAAGGAITRLALSGGFVPGRIYELFYRTSDPPVAGMGFAAVRDFVSFLRYDVGPRNPLSVNGEAAARHVISYGTSQSGRFLRHFLYEGFNEDEQGRRVFDGVLDHIAGAARGSFNHRYAQPSVFDRGHEGSGAPTVWYPFSDTAAPDPLSGRTEGLQDRLRSRGLAPKVMYSNSSAEYWGVGASLLHTDPLGEHDLTLPDDVRIYHIAGAQHAPGPFPPGDDGRMGAGTEAVGLYPGSPVLMNFTLRALLSTLESWVRDGTPPPASAYPRVDDGTLVTLAEAVRRWPAIPGVRFPGEMPQVLLYEYGPGWGRGVVDEPPVPGAAYGVRVPAPDADGNECGGIRGPELAVPLASYTGWNYRHPDRGAPEALASMVGGCFPFPVSAAAAALSRDPRRPLDDRYAGRDDYLAQVRAACDALVGRRLLLKTDVAAVLALMEQQWDHAMTHEPVA